MTTELALAGLCLWVVGYAVGNVVGFMQSILDDLEGSYVVDAMYDDLRRILAGFRGGCAGGIGGHCGHHADLSVVL